jgi:hypothetical protein
MPNRFGLYLARFARAHFPNWFDLFHVSQLHHEFFSRFLGALVSRHEVTKTIFTLMYTENLHTHADKYLDHSSDHDNQHKVSVARTLIHRDISLPSTHERKQNELDDLGNTSPGNDVQRKWKIKAQFIVLVYKL